MQTSPVADDGSMGFQDEILSFTGTQINYYFVCKRKLWLFSHNMELESESDLVHLGRLLHEHGYKRKFKEVQVDRIKVDFMERTPQRAAAPSASPASPPLTVTNDKSSITIHEVKRSKSIQDAHMFQLLYYIYCLRNTYGANVAGGVLHYPLLKTNTPIELTPERERQMQDVLRGVRDVISAQKPPEPVRIGYCKSCAYHELCWS